MKKKLYRTRYDAKIGGVCNGLAEYFDFDVSIIRIAFAFFGIFSGTGFILYLILWIILPEKQFPNQMM